MTRYVFDHLAFGKALRMWRIDEDISQVDVADMFRTSIGVVGSWEQGWNQCMSIGDLIYACEYMDVDPRQYFIHVTDDIPY